MLKSCCWHLYNSVIPVHKQHVESNEAATYDQTRPHNLNNYRSTTVKVLKYLNAPTLQSISCLSVAVVAGMCETLIRTCIKCQVQ